MHVKLSPYSSVGICAAVVTTSSLFDVHGSVHRCTVYVQLKVQLDVHVFICILYSSLFLALHVSGTICTHPQEHKLQRTAIGVCNGFGMLIRYIHLWLYAAVCVPKVGCKLHPKHVEIKNREE
jgi:hypothetical protein